MSKIVGEFEKGKKYKFTIDAFSKRGHGIAYDWISKCDGRKVKVKNPWEGKIGTWFIDPTWCEEVE